jgi:FxsC-like protein
VSYYFFLSYARGDDDLFVQRFFRDLSSEVRTHAGLSANEEVGFFDVHSLEVGEVWSPRLVLALSQCRSFIALCSPRYFVSEPCGKEWAVFADRVREYERVHKQQTAALLPLLWLPPRRLPPVVSALQFDNDDLPEAYRRAGLRQLMRLQRHQDSYLEFVSDLARRIVEVVDGHRLPARHNTVQFDTVPSVFHPTGPARPAPNSGDATTAGSPAHYVQFVVCAPSRGELEADELASVRTNHDFYGDTALDWRPYRPDLPTPIGTYARAVASQRSFESGVAGVAELGVHLAESSRYNRIVVLIVDAWSTRLPHQRRALSECDDHDRDSGESIIAVMVPSSTTDSETQLNWRQLGDSVRAIFRNRATSGDEVMFRSSILNHMSFNADLQAVLEVAKNRIFVRGPVLRPVLGEQEPRPMLDAL